MVFNEMMYNFLFLSNRGVDVIRIDAVPYIWKEIGTTCRNLPQVHTIVRMMRIIGEIVCPSVILLGLFNFGENEVKQHLPAGSFTDLLTGEKHEGGFPLPAFGFAYFKED